MDHIFRRQTPCTVSVRGPRQTLHLCKPMMGRKSIVERLTSSGTPPYLKAVSSISFQMLDSIHEECTIRFFDNCNDSKVILLSISPWTLDDSIDYTLARYPDRSLSIGDSTTE